nr:hypothetical protein [uncultured bacterium]AQS31151.1 hypothetical protein [uncultured bacterium]
MLQSNQYRYNMSVMSTAKPPRPQFGFLLYSAIGLAVIIIIGGSIWGLNQSGVNGRQMFYRISQFTTRLFGFNLLVKVDRTTLPADGQSQTTITATLIHLRQTVTASIIQGDGQIQRTPTTENPYQFTYTAGTNPGEVIILVKAGALEQTVKITLAVATIPATPIIISPPDGSAIDTPKPELSGTGLPNTKIIITDNGAVNTTTTTDTNGQFRVHLTEPLYNGQHTLSATAVSDLGINSPISNLVTVTVKTEPVKLDTSNIRISPNRAVAGSSFGLFVPASLNTTKVIAEFEGKTYELFDHNQSSIFTGTLLAPNQPGAYSISLVLTDQAGNTSRFDQIVRLTVISR